MLTEKDLQKIKELLDPRFDQIEKKLEKHDENFQDLNIYLIGRFNSVDEKFRQIDKRFVEINEKFTDIDKRFVEINKRFTDIDNQLMGMNMKFTDIDKQLIEINEKFDDHRKRIMTVQDTVVGINRFMNKELTIVSRDHENRIEVLEGKIL